VITAILILSIANVALQLIAVFQRHAQLQAHRENGNGTKGEAEWY
jgi:hypothetical protein